MATVYLAAVPARLTRERHQVKLGVVRLVNEGQTFSVTRGDSSCAYPKRVLLDTGAQPVMLGRRLANELGFVPHDLDPCPFTIATSLGGTEQPAGLTKEPLRLQFKVGADSYTYVAVRCVVTNATTYDIFWGNRHCTLLALVMTVGRRKHGSSQGGHSEMATKRAYQLASATWQAW